MKRTLWLAALAALSLLAAAPADAQSGSRNRGRIEREEIDAAHSGNVLQLVRSRRPAWLNRQHPTSVTSASGRAELLVFLDGARLDGVAELQQVSSSGVETVEFLNAGQTEFRFGQFSPNGSIVVTSRGAAPTGAPDRAPATDQRD